MTKRLVPFLLFALATTGCTMRASERCETAWQSSPDDGSACETSVAELDATGDATDTATDGATDTTDVTARDVSTGLATGRRQHKPFHATLAL